MSVFGAGRSYGLESPRGEDWRKRSACRDQDPELFFPLGEGGFRTGDALAQEQEAAAFCVAACPVRSECLKWAQETGQDTGVWGGLNELERMSRPDFQSAKHDDGRAHGVRRTHCAKGHALTPDNVRERFYRGRVIRECHTCRLRRDSDARARARVAVAA
ncbi:hypothetical protein GCM10009662_07020 [Catellatospora coxensis]|uniref:Transcriptional regulator WhiB n=1 Tax=Catellatospora coxensis TaxID=310354 RepID=A0A8J3L1A9_9ACTN|nr:hypothetical protein Cco03nite_68770 [Catellatospora coxensis]